MLAIIAHNISDVNRILNCVWRGEVAVYEDSGATQMLQKISLILVKSKNETKVDPQNPIYGQLHSKWEMKNVSKCYTTSLFANIFPRCDWVKCR